MRLDDMRLLGIVEQFPGGPSMRGSLPVLAVLLAALTLGPWALAAEPQTYGCYFILDGLRGDMAKKYAEQGVMPNLKKYFLDRGVWVDQATSVFPSITGAAVSSLVTGAFPGRHRLPSLYFFERQERKYYVLYTVKGSKLFNKMLDDKRTKTIFEHFPGKSDTWAIGLQVNRGADSKIPIEWGMKYKPLVIRAKVGEFFRSLKRGLLGGDRARLVVIYNGWFDHAQHGKGPEAEALKQDYVLADWQLGEAIKAYQEQGIFDRTYFVLASDHGQLTFDKRVNIWDFIKGNYHLPVVEYDWVKIFPGLPLDWDTRNPKDYQDYAMVVTAGEAHALLYFAKPLPGGGRDWDHRPSWDELRHYPTGKGEYADSIEVARNQDAVDFVVGKRYEDGCVWVFGKGKAQARIERKEGPNGSSYRYTVAEGDTDPLKFMNEPRVRSLVNRNAGDTTGSMFFSDSEWQVATCLTNYPDAVAQLFQAFDSDRAPDLFISGAPGYYLIGTTWDGDISRHGALNKYESHTTLAVSGPGLVKESVLTARSVDAVPTLLHCLQVPHDPGLMDGRVLPAVEARLMGPNESSSVKTRFSPFLDQVRRLAELAAIQGGLQRIGVGGNNDVARLLEVQKHYQEMADLVTTQSAALVRSFVGSSVPDSDIQDLIRLVRALAPDDLELVKPTIKEIARALRNKELGAALRATLKSPGN
ncbi:MAG: alkaline phosphatase family protein [Candidatus Riflebacteria bacterium]|nr:alkaline phosphatase family protein [Candidatus Riflebacteria bacterium]